MVRFNWQLDGRPPGQDRHQEEALDRGNREDEWIALAGDDPDPDNGLAYALHAQGKLDDALTAFGRVLRRFEGGSTDPSSQGFVTITMIIAQNGNALSGTASIPPPDATTWSISGKETGQSVDGRFTVTGSNSLCASDGEFTGAFTADTLDATFVEVRPDDWTPAQEAECGPVESGLFRLVKQ